MPVVKVSGDRVLSHCSTIQVRNTQLDKEARELRAETTSMQETLDRVKHEAVSGEKARLPSPPAVVRPCVTGAA